METRKVFVLDSRGVQEIVEGVYFEISDKGFEPIIKCSEEPKVRKLPEGYDLYILHLSNIDLENVKELKAEQPWSKFIGVSGSGENIAIGNSYLISPSESRRVFDKVYSSFVSRDLSDLL